ncbi:MAG: FAD-dependent monooxygenase [Actinomycetota bacterium]|nr:FAD-dependent monooxygenase [Actinomycetota bacterium]
MTVERHDVVIVGARCAGAPLAAHLSRAGLSVALLDRAHFPSDTASTHIFQAGGLAVLGRLGLTDRLVATGAPWLEMADMHLGDFSAREPWPSEPGDPGPAMCVRRPVLDAILLDAARDAGATVHTGTRVTELVREGRRVAGVVAAGDGGERRFLAPLVVGADGRSSKVARLVGARTYNVAPNERFGFWAYFEGATWSPPAAILLVRDERFVTACPTDAGLFMVGILPPLAELASFTPDVEAAYDDYVARCPQLTDVLAGARRTARPRGISSFSGFFRESAGPGWVLVGDAGHFKDPAPGQGISDAFRQGEMLAAAIADAGGMTEAIDEATARWWRWRDRDAAGMHWFAHDLGAAGPIPIVFSGIVRGLADEPDGLRRAVDVFNHRVAPKELLTPRRLAVSAAQAIASRRHPPGVVLAEVRELVGREVQRRWHNHYPRFASASPVPQADPATAAGG